MTPDERMAFLTEIPRVGVLAIEAPDRGPIASPLWYSVEPDGTITFSVGASSQKTRLLRAAGRATLCAQSEEAPYRYVSVEGRVEERGPSSDDERRERAHRYLGAEVGEAYHLSTRAEPDVTFALRPERWATVDYNKMFG
jgi:PPOX class probable F420-dependent enzyme